MTHSKRADRALAQLAEIDPALSILALWCLHRDGDAVTRTVGDTIAYGPEFTSFGLAEQTAIVAHHVLHVAFRHSDRALVMSERLGAEFDADLFGIAADGLVNQTLALADHALPRPAVLASELLADIGESAPSPVAILQDWDVERLAIFLHADKTRADRARAYGQKQGFKQDVAVGQTGETDQRKSDLDWQNHVTRALNAGRRAGSGIGKYGAIIGGLSPATTPWEVRLRGLMARAISHDPVPSFRRPSSRWIAMVANGGAEPAFQPGRARDAMRPRIVVAIDTSSSIDPLSMQLFANETQGVSRRTGAETHVLAFDEKVYATLALSDFGGATASSMDLRSGGGTDFRPVIQAAARYWPSILVVLTDLDAPFGPKPDFPVLWAVNGDSTVIPPFGDVLQLEH
ncbi:VWA-like domain-containing protein [Gymnodinialimonas sp. 2305UL16-5]|uniref:vWA domain-containing protein n=1 Tax=Gymnodinialimonas mytili TaxID=3126503 RepID=UPI00309CEB4D